MVKLRSYNLKTREEARWDTISTAPNGCRDYSMPEEGSGVLDSNGLEIFRGDILAIAGRFFLARKRDGALWFEDLERDGGLWIHEVSRMVRDKQEPVTVSGNCHTDAEYIVACLNKKIHSGIIPREIQAEIKTSTQL